MYQIMNLKNTNKIRLPKIILTFSFLVFFSFSLLLNPTFILSQDNNNNQESTAINTQKDNIEPQQNTTNFIGFPIALYQPETSLMIGGGATVTMRDPNKLFDKRPNSLNLFAIYTLKNQLAINLNPDFYFCDDRLEIKLLTSYQNFPDSFYGIGNNTSEENEEEFTTEDFMIQPWVIRRVFKNLRIGFVYDFKHTNVLETEKQGHLTNGFFKGVQGGTLSGCGPVLDWDSRDNIFYPSKGSWFQFYCAFYRNWLGSDFAYEAYAIDLRQYLSISNSKILAFQVYGSSLTGDITFNEYARLSALRGILASRFRDRKMAFAQVEYRYPIRNRFSGVLFAATGDVLDTVSDYEIKNLKYSYGFGLRYLLNQEDKINLRLDIGISKWGICPYFQISEAF